VAHRRRQLRRCPLPPGLPRHRPRLPRRPAAAGVRLRRRAGGAAEPRPMP